MALCAVGDVLKYFIPCGTRRRDIPRQQELCDRPYTGRYGTGRSDESDGPVRGFRDEATSSEASPADPDL